MADGEPLTRGYLNEIGVQGGPAATPSPEAKAAVASSPVAAAPATAPAASSGKKAGKLAPPASTAAPTSAPPAAPFKALSPEDVAKLSKEERKAYHVARIAAEKAGAPAEQPQKAQLTKAERAAKQEAERKAKEDKKQAEEDAKEAEEQMKMLGLSLENAKALIESEKAKKEEDEEEDDDEDDDPEDFLGAVRKFVKNLQEEVTEDTLREFNLQVRFQGHENKVPCDHLGAIVRVLVEDACSACDLTTPKLQPTAVEKSLKPAMARWTPLLRILYKKIDDPLQGADVLLQAMQEAVTAVGSTAPEANRGCGVVGSLMAIRDTEIIDDEDLLTGCRRSEPKSRVMEKFIEHLEDELDDEDEDGDDD